MTGKQCLKIHQLNLKDLRSMWRRGIWVIQSTWTPKWYLIKYYMNESLINFP